MSSTARPYSSFMCCGVRIDALDASQAAGEIMARVGQPCAVHLCNAYTLSIATKSSEFAELLNRGDLNLPDGMPLVWIARRLGIPLADRAYGPDVMAKVMDRGRKAGITHYLYGSSPEVISSLEANIPATWPGSKVVGAESPPFRELTTEEAEAMVERVNSVSPDVVWVGLGAPKQDRFVDRFRGRINAPLVPVGAAFDFHAGAIPQAPTWMQERCLEWAYRLAKEPRRLWRRYLVGNLVFLMGVARARPRRLGGIP